MLSNTKKIFEDKSKEYIGQNKNAVKSEVLIKKEMINKHLNGFMCKICIKDFKNRKI